MERKKITNWETLLSMMTNYWFEVNGINQMVLKFIKHPEQVEIFTTTRQHYKKYDQIELALYDWTPIEHQGTEPLNILDYAIFADGTTGKLAQQSLELAIKSGQIGLKEMSFILIRENAILLHEHKAINKKLKNKMNDMLQKLDTLAPGHHYYKDAQVLSQMMNDTVNMNAQELKDLALFQKSLEAANDSLNQQPDEDNNTNTQD